MSREEPRFLNLRDGGNLPAEPSAPFPLIIALILLLCMAALAFNKTLAQAAFDQINAGRSEHVCGAC